MPAKTVSTNFGIFAICATVLTTFLFAAAFASEYEGNCTPDAAGKAQCTQHFAWKGFGGVPIEPLATAIGTGMGAYVAFRSRRSQTTTEPDVPSPGR